MSALSIGHLDIAVPYIDRKDEIGGMAVAAAFWGIWHAVSGLGLAALMARTQAKR